MQNSGFVGRLGDSLIRTCELVQVYENQTSFKQCMNYVGLRSIALFIYVLSCALIVYICNMILAYAHTGSLLKRRPSVILVLTCPLDTVQETALE